MSSPPFTVKAIFEYSSDHDDDLTFPIGQVVTVTAEEDDEWYYGEYADTSGIRREGIFPKNFVEKYEPPAPPRPATRPKKKEPEVSLATPVTESPASVATPAASLPAETPYVGESKSHQPEPEVLTEEPTAHHYETVAHPPQSPPLPASSTLVASSSIPSSPPKSTPLPVSTSEPASKPASKPPPPAVAEKPKSSSFKDRIAAFNKPSEAPIAPSQKPIQGQSFVKKPFSFPPPSKDSYVPPPRQPPVKPYKREEDPDVIKQTVPREPPVSESQPNLNEMAATPRGDDEQPRPTTLKDRIALLQRQQLEQVARHSDTGLAKDKAKRPPKKHAEHPEDQPVQAETGDSEKSPTVEGAREPALESPVKEAAPHTLPSHETVSDSNDADYPAAADTDEAGAPAGKEDYEDDSRKEHHDVEQEGEEPAEGAEDEKREEEEQEEKGGGEEAEEEEDVDPEVKRRLELRQRMAKMSGGMGMMGFFGGGMPVPGPGPRKPKPRPEPEKHDETEKSASAAAAPVPIMALPGLNARKLSEPKTAPPESAENYEEESGAPSVTGQHRPEEGSDIEESVHEKSSQRDSSDNPPAPPPHRK